jgi:hypothetical protein
MEFVNEYRYDIAIVGGGVAGCAAAVEAARAGKSVLLIEKSTQLGGLATIGLVNLFVPMCNGRGTRIIRGMAEEFLQLAIRYGWDCIPSDWKNGEPGQGNTTQRMVSRFSPAIFALALCELLDELGVKILFDTVLTGVDGGEGGIRRLILFNKSGYSCACAKIYIDASGDADLCAMAGAPTVTRGNFHSYCPLAATLESCQKAVEKQDIAHLTLNVHRSGGNATLFGDRHPEGKPLWDGTNGEDVTRYLVENQRQLLNNIKGEDRKSRDLTCIPIMPQFRTTRCLVGNATLREEDVYRHCEDSICAINDFEFRDRLFEVPYGVMVRDGFDDLLAVGRCASGEGYGWDVLRVIPPAILTGQAAGAAAVQAISRGVGVTAVDVKALQEQLAKEDVMIHFDDALIPQTETKESVDVGEA